jgi:hypothetical protein
VWLNRGWREARQFIHQQVRLVDQDRETLRTDVFRFALEGQAQQGAFLFGAVAIQANMIVHDFSNRQFKILNLY